MCSTVFWCLCLLKPVHKRKYFFPLMYLLIYYSPVLRGKTNHFNSYKQIPCVFQVQFWSWCNDLTVNIAGRGDCVHADPNQHMCWTPDSCAEDRPFMCRATVDRAKSDHCKLAFWIFLIFRGQKSCLWGHWCTFFKLLTSDICSGFQNQGESNTYMFCRKNWLLRFTSGLVFTIFTNTE